jgi:prepilin-type processing-associated H-X9-DG protein/prepilin-type N-terminal cleavage/methylation domain-containing protein
MKSFNRPPRRRPAAGFTLIELLTVIAIIGILAAILIPVTGRVRASAKQSKCAANLRTVHHGFNLYAADHQGYYPAARFHAGQSDPSKGRRNQSFNNGAYGNHWEGELRPYVGVNLRSVAGTTSPVASFAICPDGLTGMNPQLVYRGPDFASSGYSLDYQVKAVQIRNPAQTVLVGDSDDYHLSLWAAMQPDGNGKYSSGDPVRHSGKANYLFVDGHVEVLDLTRAIAALQEAKSAP